MHKQCLFQFLFLTAADRNRGIVGKGDFAFVYTFDMGKGHQVAPVGAEKAVGCQFPFVVRQIVPHSVGIGFRADQNILILRLLVYVFIIK